MLRCSCPLPSWSGFNQGELSRLANITYSLIYGGGNSTTGDNITLTHTDNAGTRHTLASVHRSGYSGTGSFYLQPYYGIAGEAQIAHGQ